MYSIIYNIIGFTAENPGNILDFYNVGTKNLNTHSSSYVSKATHKVNGELRAVKSVPKAQVSGFGRFRLEMDILRTMKWPHGGTKERYPQGHSKRFKKTNLGKMPKRKS